MDTPSALCRSCSAPLEILLDGGVLPIANRYSSSPEDAIACWPKRFGCCSVCGLAQLVDPAPATLLDPRLDWLVPNEPEEHLDRLTARLVKGKARSAGGLGPKDFSLLRRLSDAGTPTAWQLSPENLGLPAAAGVASLQAHLTEADFLPNEPVDLLIARHIVEHVHALPLFFKITRQLVTDEGWLFIEVPACERELQECDYARLWEDHTQYFTSDSLRNTIAAHGYSVHWEKRVQTSQEELLLLLVRKGGFPVSFTPSVAPEASVALAQSFARTFFAYKKTIREILNRYTTPIAMLGTGHLGLSFLHLMGLADSIQFLFDDHPHKQGKYAAGLPCVIRPTALLASSGAKLCLIAVNPSAEERIVSRHTAFSENGGVFASVFPNSNRYIMKMTSKK